jgi:hypothetical protein
MVDEWFSGGAESVDFSKEFRDISTLSTASVFYFGCHGFASRCALRVVMVSHVSS